MKKNDERQICPPDTQCLSGFIGTILALVISVLAWVQKLSYIPSLAKQDCPEFCEFTRTIEKLKEITVQAEAMSKPPPPTKKEEEDCICIRDDFNQMSSDDERDNVQLLYVEPKKTRGSESCAKCCQKIPSGGKVLYVEAYGKDFGQKTSETQTTSAQLRDGTTQPNPAVRLEKETQDSRDVKIGIAQASKVECTCDHTQVSDSSLPDSRKAQEENQLQATRREETDDRGGSYMAHKQYKASMDLKKSYLASKQSRSSEEEQIAAVYRTLISDDNYDADLEEEEENYFDSVCSELYRPCRQETPPYYQYQQVRQPSPHTKRETVAKKQDADKPELGESQMQKVKSDTANEDESDLDFGQQATNEFLATSTPKKEEKIDLIQNEQHLPVISVPKQQCDPTTTKIRMQNRQNCAIDCVRSCGIKKLSPTHEALAPDFFMTEPYQQKHQVEETLSKRNRSKPQEDEQVKLDTLQSIYGTSAPDKTVAGASPGPAGNVARKLDFEEESDDEVD